MQLHQLNPHLKALVDAVPTLSDVDKFNLAQKCKNIVIRCGDDPKEAPVEEPVEGKGAEQGPTE